MPGPSIGVTLNDMIDKLIAALHADYKAAFDRGDVETANKLSALIREASVKLSDPELADSPLMREMEKVGKGERLLLTETWAEARDVLASIDRAVLPDMNRPGVLNNLAYATAQAGDPEKAIPLIEQARAEADRMGDDYPNEKRQFMRATHGIALSLAGRNEEAVALIEPVIAIENPKRARTTRAFYLAKSYAALGRADDAARMFELAAGGEGAFAPRAKEALAKLRG